MIFKKKNLNWYLENEEAVRVSVERKGKQVGNGQTGLLWKADAMPLGVLTSHQGTGREGRKMDSLQEFNTSYRKHRLIYFLIRKEN